MPYEVFLERNAEKDLHKLPSKIRNKVIGIILELKNDPRPLKVRKITDSRDYFRVKAGDYRIVYEISDKEKRVNIFRIRHRKEAYSNLL
ncbi:MAG: type II toxin-antitoxin system RelE/ParE family toxin [Patescibacteria group bacterium]